MTNFRTIAVTICFAVELGLAQEAPRFEIFGGYSFSEQAQPSEGGHSATNGWQAALKFDLTPRIGLVAEGGGQYGTPRYNGPITFANFVYLPGTSFSTHTLLFGPEVNVYRRGRVSINARILVGAGRLGNPGSTYVTAGSSPAPQVLRVRGSVDYGFAAAAGGSVDLRLKGGFSWRVVQPEVVATRFERAWRADFRAATGLMFSFGGR